MTALNAGIILAGNNPDLMGAYSGGMQAAGQRNALMDQNALRSLYAAQGPGIVAGEAGAVNALARLDPGAAMGVQDRQTARQNAATSAQRAALEWAQSQDARTVAAEAAKTEKLLSGAAYFHARGDKAGYEDFVRQQGGDPAQYPFERFPALAAQAGQALEVWKGFVPETIDPTKGAPEGMMFVNPRNPAEGVVPLPGYQSKPGDEYQRYVQEEAAAGRTPMGRLEFEQAKKGKGFSTTITNADGSSTTISMGGAQGTGEPTVGETYNPNEVQNVLGMIEQIRNDPNLPRVLGPLEGGGGNNVDDFNMPRRAYYGGDGVALVEKIGQLQSNAWLSARQMLKGGGAITDYESRKAEAAVARLSRVKSEEEFLAALDELDSAIRDGLAKLQGRGAAAPAQTTQAAPAAPATTPGDMSDDDLLRMYGGN